MFIHGGMVKRNKPFSISALLGGYFQSRSGIDRSVQEKIALKYYMYQVCVIYIYRYNRVPNKYIFIDPKAHFVHHMSMFEHLHANKNGFAEVCKQVVACYFEFKEQILLRLLRY